MVLTVFPSPLVVGVIAVTRMSLPRALGKSLERFESNLRDRVSVRFEKIASQPKAGSNVGNRGHRKHAILAISPPSPSLGPVAGFGAAGWDNLFEGTSVSYFECLGIQRISCTARSTR